MKSHTYIILFFMVLGTMYAQRTEYVLHTAYTNQIIAESRYVPAMYEVEDSQFSESYPENPTLADEKILIQKKIDTNGSFTIGNPSDIKLLAGNFRFLGKYWVIREDYGVFLKKGLVKEHLFTATDLSTVPLDVEDCDMLIKDITTNRYYLVPESFLKKMESYSEKKAIHKQMVTTPIRKKNLERISSVTFSIEEYIQMIERSKELTASLIVHGRMFKKGLMNKKQLRNWKTDLEEAKLLNEQIKSFTSVYEQKGYPLNESLKKETLGNQKDFSKIITEASQDISL